MSSAHGDWVAYTYYPSMGAAVVFVVLFAIVTILHTFQMFRTRTWFFIPLVIGGCCMYLIGNLSPWVLLNILTEVNS